MRVIYSREDQNGNEYRVQTTPSGLSLVERNQGEQDSRFFIVAVCQTKIEAIAKAQKLVAA